MTSQADINCFFGDGGEALVREAVSFVFGQDNWARSLVGANSGWNEKTPPAGVVAEQWFFPFNPRMVSGVGGEAEVDEWMSCEFVRQDPSGVFNICSCDVRVLPNWLRLELILSIGSLVLCLLFLDLFVFPLIGCIRGFF